MNKKFKNPVTREEAEFMIDWYNGIVNLGWGIPDDSKFKKAFDRADKIRRSLWEKTFGDKSIYVCKLKNNRNRTAYLAVDRFKEKRLMSED